MPRDIGPIDDLGWNQTDSVKRESAGILPGSARITLDRESVDQGSITPSRPEIGAHFRGKLMLWPHSQSPPSDLCDHGNVWPFARPPIPDQVLILYFASDAAAPFLLTATHDNGLLFSASGTDPNTLAFYAVVEPTATRAPIVAWTLSAQAGENVMPPDSLGASGVYSVALRIPAWFDLAPREHNPR
jgi:hypothetical protein